MSANSAISTADDVLGPPLDKARHLRYWQRCLRTLLPHHYTPNDSQRLSLAFFVLAAIDLLSPAHDPSAKPLLTRPDRRDFRQWVLSCQHPGGGFCGSPAHVLPAHEQQRGDDDGNANIAATSFALLLLALLAENGDGEGAFAGVDRARTLAWLRRLQRRDGSFGENTYHSTGDGDGDGEEERMVAGGRDMRYCFLAATIRWMLRGDDRTGPGPGARGREDPAWVEDIDVDALVAHVRRGQTYDGGVAESSRHESHAGYAYCAVAALALLERPDDEEEGGARSDKEQACLLRRGLPDMPGLVSFLVSRQFAYLEGSSSSADTDGEDGEGQQDPETANLRQLSLDDGSPPPSMPQYVAYNGRCNKAADTCYTWWVDGSLAVLGRGHGLGLGLGHGHGHDDDHAAAPPPAVLRAQRQFLLDKTQHAIGGFGKHPGSPPDLYHGYLGLAALATMGDPGLKRFDPALCVSEDAVGRIRAGRRGLIRRARVEAEAAAAASAGGDAGVDAGAAGAAAGEGAFRTRLVDMAVVMGSEPRPDWLRTVV